MPNAAFSEGDLAMLVGDIGAVVLDVGERAATAEDGVRVVVVGGGATAFVAVGFGVAVVVEELKEVAAEEVACSAAAATATAIAA